MKQQAVKRWNARAGLALAVWLTIGGISEAAYVLLTDGRRVDGTEIRARANGDVVLKTERGDLTFTKGQYREAWADRPAVMDSARQALERGQYDAVIEEIANVPSEFRFLSWDVEALRMIGMAELGKGDAAAALASFEELFERAPHRQRDSEIKWSYYQAMLGAGELGDLERELDGLIRDGSRDDAARAQVMRGDLKRQRNLDEAALLDYLRTVVLFKKERAVQAEAHFKAAEVLDARRDNRARGLYETVVQEYPESPYAARARQKL
jgi:outer membrane protein assembly factor BamD (BamD/ComL family)